MIFNRNNNISIISIIILITTACSQAQDNQLAKNKQGDNPSEEYSLLSKKNYQNRLTKWLHPYKIDVQQGNLITNEMLKNVKIGMNKQQVKHILGTSLLTDSLSKNKWVYSFSDAANGAVQKEQLLVLTFKNERLQDIQENTVVNQK